MHTNTHKHMDTIARRVLNVLTGNPKWINTYYKGKPCSDGGKALQIVLSTVLSSNPYADINWKTDIIELQPVTCILLILLQRKGKFKRKSHSY